MKNNSKTLGGWSLLPFLVFIFLYLGVPLYQSYQGNPHPLTLKAPIAMATAIAMAMMFFRGTLNEKVDTFIKGLGSYEIVYIILTLFLAGSFSALTTAIGGVETLTNLGLSFMPAGYLIAGIFVITSLVAVATGTSVGSIAALAPIAIELADKSHSSLAYAMAAVMGGAMFGDGLSLISDTTIISSRTQGCEGIDTFKYNSLYAIPAAILATCLFAFLGETGQADLSRDLSYDLVKALPYLAIFLLSIFGFNVIFVFFSGIVLSLAIGVHYGIFSLLEGSEQLWKGLTSMDEIVYFVLLTGGLSSLVVKEKGFKWILKKITCFISGKKSAEVSIALLSWIHDLAIANNGVAILVTGNVVRNLSEKYKIASDRSSALLESYTCIAQSFLPYGSQMLLMMTLTQGRLSLCDIYPLLFYQICQFILLSLSIAGLKVEVWTKVFLPNRLFKKPSRSHTKT